jgi:hypothetical protein
MRKRLVPAGPTAVALAVGLALAACGEPGPSHAARQFYATVERGELDQLYKYATPETVTAVAMFAEKLQGMLALKGGIASTKEAIDGNSATVTVTFRDGTSETIDLVKGDGRWKVCVNDEK